MRLLRNDAHPMAAAEQPKPRRLRGREKHVDVATLAQKDLEARVRAGEKKYGQRLRANNGRDVLMDIYQEQLDALLYIRQLIYERDGK